MLAVLYASYVPAQIPSNMVIRVTTDLEVISIDLSFVDLKSDIQVCIASVLCGQASVHAVAGRHTTFRHVLSFGG